MFFEQINDLPTIATRTGTSVFVIPPNLPIDIPHAIILEPTDKTVITIEQARNIMSRLNTRQTSDQFVIIRPAESLGDEAANALLKNLEEPGDKIHFILVTSKPSRLLPTILSRASIYFLRTKPIDNLQADVKTKEIAKKLLIAKGPDLVKLAEDITKKKDQVRAYALNILGTSIEILYKTYFITKKPIFIEKLPKFLAAYEAIEQNGHVKLQIIANLC